jgi:purine-nucleoside phosphorylase
MIDIARHKQQVEETVAFLQERIYRKPEIVIVLGTGLSGLADCLDVDLVFSYGDIPHFPVSTVESHAGNLLFGKLNNRAVAILQGRFHYYEGYSTRELTFPVRVLSLLGAKILLATNAAGGLNPSFEPGSIMVVEDHINFIPDNPLRGPNVDEWGPRFPDLSEPYDKKLIAVARECAEKLALERVASGVYAAIPGPSLETPAETRFFRSSGADAVGMSSVPEVIVAIHAGMKVLCLSAIANVNDPDNFQSITLEDVVRKAGEIEPALLALIKEILGEL